MEASGEGSDRDGNARGNSGNDSGTRDEERSAGCKPSSVDDTSEDSEEEETDDKMNSDTRVISMLYKGNMAEVCRQEQRGRKAGIFNHKHDFYRHTRCTSVAPL